MKPYLNPGVFNELRDKQYFEQVSIFLGAVTWPNEQDIAPETLVAGLMQKPKIKRGQNAILLKFDLIRQPEPARLFATQ